MIKTIHPNAYYNGVYGSIVVGNKMYFIAEDPSYGFELWVSDGTSAGTNMVRDIYVGGYSSFPSPPVAMGNTVYFMADDGNSGSNFGKVMGHISARVWSKTSIKVLVQVEQAVLQF